ncbi:MAG: hypothetical protein ABS935_12155 [Solibacillus sp.]|uniref:hypothetical protein n=1 Tax=Solibacillus sp. TaxID=1909654 RepID=UPI003315270D
MEEKKSSKYRVTYEFDEQHVNLFSELQKKSDIPNRRKNRGLKGLLALIGVFSIFYIIIMRKRFNANIAEAQFQDNINFINVVVNAELESGGLKNYLLINGEYISLLILTLIVYWFYIWRTKNKKNKIMDYLHIDEKEIENIKNTSAIERRLKNFFSIDLYLSKIHKTLLLENDKGRQDQSLKDKKNGWYAYQNLKTKEGLMHSKTWGLIRIRRKFLIEISNWNNVTLATWLFGIAIIFNFIDVWDISGHFAGDFFRKLLIYFRELLLMFFLSYLVVRIISRGIEIAFAFYTDVVKINSKLFYYYNDNEYQDKEYINKFNSSLLRTNARLSLAIHTLIEVVITFSVLYWLLLMLFSNQNNDVTLVETLLFSFSISAFNFSFMSYELMLFTIFHVLQVLLSVVLILISLAQYIGGEELTSEEKDFYADVKGSMYQKEKVEEV